MNPAVQNATTVLAGHDQTPGLQRVHAVVMSFVAGISATIAVSGFLAASDYRPDNTGNASAAVDTFASILHAHSVEWLVAVVLVYLGVALLDPQARLPQRTARLMLAFYSLVLTTSWCGSILEWDDRAKQAFGIGTHIFDSYVPIVGTIISHYLWQSNRFREPSMMRVFLLHVVVLAPAVLLVFRALRRHAVWNTTTVFMFGVGVIVPICSIQLLPLVSIAQEVLAQPRPAWYLGVPYELLRVLPEDFVIALFGLAAIVMFVFGAGTGHSVSQRFGQWSARILYAVYVAFQIQIFIAWHVR
jgi:quinol-cytochrome oxidoreductase complex cytochrome b subunit